MKMNVGRKIELIANLAIIAVACMLGVILAKNYLARDTRNKADSETHSIVVSPTVSSLDIDWLQNKQTLLLAVSSTCHFCSESAPFYKELAREHPNTRLIAIFPQSIAEGMRYLNNLGITVDGVKHATLSSINVNGTPTLILVNSNGVVLNTWVGKLLEAQQEEVLTKVRS